MVEIRSHGKGGGGVDVRCGNLAVAPGSLDPKPPLFLGIFYGMLSVTIVSVHCTLIFYLSADKVFFLHLC